MKIKIFIDKKVHCPYGTNTCEHPIRCIRMRGQECYLKQNLESLSRAQITVIKKRNSEGKNKYLRRIQNGKNKSKKPNY